MLLPAMVNWCKIKTYKHLYVCVSMVLCMPRFCILERGWETVGACYGLLLVTSLYSPFLRNFHTLHHPGIFFIFVCSFGEKSRAISNVSFHGWCYNSFFNMNFLYILPLFLKKNLPNFAPFWGHVAITLLLSTGYSFNNPLQKCHQLMQNLT
jgi:hypothetical protein